MRLGGQVQVTQVGRGVTQRIEQGLVQEGAPTSATVAQAQTFEMPQCAQGTEVAWSGHTKYKLSYVGAVRDKKLRAGRKGLLSGGLRTGHFVQQVDYSQTREQLHLALFQPTYGLRRVTAQLAQRGHLLEQRGQLVLRQEVPAKRRARPGARRRHKPHQAESLQGLVRTGRRQTPHVDWHVGVQLLQEFGLGKKYRQPLHVLIALRHARLAQSRTQATADVSLRLARAPDPGHAQPRQHRWLDDSQQSPQVGVRDEQPVEQQFVQPVGHAQGRQVPPCHLAHGRLSDHPVGQLPKLQTR